MHQQIIHFWFEEIKAKQWFVKDHAFDQLIIDRFSLIHQQATAGELWQWRETSEGRLAEIIVLDQFSRNMFRDSAHSFAYDALALVLAQEAIAFGTDQELNPSQKSFLYMPFMHSESAAIHEQAVTLFNQDGMESNYNFELKHKKIIDEFGRYPHRNIVLSRESTPEELIFLSQPNSSF